MHCKKIFLKHPTEGRTQRRVVHSDDDVPLVEAGGDLPGASRRLALVRGGSCGTSQTLPDVPAPSQRVGVPPSAPETVPASSSAVRRLVLVQSQASSEVETARRMKWICRTVSPCSRTPS